MIQMPPTHSRAKIARRLLDAHHALENIRLENGYGNIQRPRVIFYNFAVNRAISGVHYQKNKLERQLIVPLQFLKKLRHRKRVLSAGHAHGNFIARLNQIIIDNRLRKARKQLFAEPFADTLLRSFGNVLCGSRILPPAYAAVKRISPAFTADFLLNFFHTAIIRSWG